MNPSERLETRSAFRFGPRILVRSAFAVAACLGFLLFPSQAGAEDPPPLKVGSKVFTESVILGEILTQLLRSEGIPAEHRAELGGTQILWQALLKGDVDLYVDYTGTIREELLDGRTLLEENAMREALSARGATMSPRLGFNNSYAIGLRRSRAEELKLTKISQLADLPQLKFGFSDEFMARPDGWPQLAAKYRLPQRKIQTMDHALAYRGLESGAIDAADLYSTDAEIAHLNLTVLEDDKAFFPSYHAVVLARDDLGKRNPRAAAVLEKLTGKIDVAAMVEMNARVRIQRASEAETAARFLEAKLGVATPPAVGPSFGSQAGQVMTRLGRTTAEHLFLVAVSLSAAVAAAIPLGIASARSPRLGRFVLSTVSVVQTLPSMALLVFMVPILGLGAAPAILALFLYSLLPIVRNTHGGLTQIPANLRESAEVLGLPASARLWRVELPLATPSILSGIKTAAVINVGTATIGALVGAGGYGAPILTGIRLSDVGLILQGAVPAAVLAIAVQSGFTWLERWIVPRGLQIQARAE